MEIKKEKLTLKLNENIEELKKEIEELEQLLKTVKNETEQKILAGKTQMIGKSKNIKPRSRQEHSENISQISSEMIKRIYEEAIPKNLKEKEIYKLNLKKDILYTKIISLAHDLGHTPYGHLGERIVNDYVRKYPIKEIDTQKIIKKRIKIFGKEYEESQGHSENFKGKISFQHNEKSAEIIDKIIEQEGIKKDYINKKRIIQGVLCHSTSRVKEENVPDDLVIQIIRLNDKTEYINFDYEEIKKYINIEEIEEKEIKEFAKKELKEKIEQIIEEVVKEGIQKGRISEKMEGIKILKKLRKQYEKIMFITEEDGKNGLLIEENTERITIIIKKLLKYYSNHIEETEGEKIRLVHPIKEDSKEKGEKIKIESIKKNKTDIEKVVEYICNMDDNQIEQTYKRLVRSRIVNGKNYGIEPITKEEIKELQKQQFQKEIDKLKYKDLEENELQHSDDEYKEQIINKNKQIKEILNEKGYKQIEEIRKKHQEENKKDEKYLEMLKIADEKRKENGKLELKEKIKIREEVKEI